MKYFLILFLTLATLNVQAQNSICPDVAGAVPHPLLDNYKGSCIIGYNEIKFDAVTLPVSKVTIKGTEKKLVVEGKVTDIIYGIDNAQKATVLEIQRNYEQALKKAGFEILFSAFGRKQISDRRTIADSYPAFGSVDFMKSLKYVKPGNFRFAFSLHNSSQENDGAYFLARGKKGSTNYTLAINIRYNRTSWKELTDHIFIQAKIIEAQAMDTDQVTAASIEEKIKNEGKEVFHNILFDFGSDKLTSESYLVIETLAQYLNSNKELNYYIVGHTDNVGSLATNQLLSEKRAKAVHAALVTKFNVKAAQISAHGVGQLSPLAINITEEGRALNRRVEVVLE